MASASKPFANEGEEEFDERRQLVRRKNTPDKNGKADTVIKDHLKDTQVVTWRLALAIFSAVLGMFNFGYNTGVINSPQAVIEAFINDTTVSRSGEAADQDTITLIWSFAVAIFAIGGMIGGLLAGTMADRFGRKRSMLINTFFGILAGGLMGFSSVADSYEMIIIGRLIVGFHCGLSTGLAPLYNSEVAPVSMRGAIGVLNQLAVTVGISISQILGLTEILGDEYYWPLLLGLTAAPAILQLLTLPFSQESPRYLLLVKDQEEDAIEALKIFRGAKSSKQVYPEIEAILQEKKSQEDVQQMSIFSLMCNSALRYPLVIAIVMHLSQQLSGINCIFYYSTNLFTKVGLDEDTAKYATLGVGGIMVGMTIVTIPLMDRAGRRTLHLCGLAGMFIFSIVFTITFSLNEKGEGLQYAAIVSALIVVVFFALGPGSIPWMIVAEMFSQGPRTPAISITVVVNWLANFAVGQSFPPLQEALQELVFIPYTVLLAFFFIFLFITLPETKGKPIEEITAMFDKRHKKYGANSDTAPTEGYSTNL